MSHFLERLTYLARRREPFADGLGELRDEDRMWEEGYRQRWQHDKIVRSTHGVNCTGGCSWKIYVKSGVVTWETQQTDEAHASTGAMVLRASRHALTSRLRTIGYLIRLAL